MFLNLVMPPEAEVVGAVSHVPSQGTDPGEVPGYQSKEG